MRNASRSGLVDSIAVEHQQGFKHTTRLLSPRIVELQIFTSLELRYRQPRLTPEYLTSVLFVLSVMAGTAAVSISLMKRVADKNWKLDLALKTTISNSLLNGIDTQ